jgi:DNA-directed RNA polymerase subunit omega
MRDDYLQEAIKVIPNPNILINLVSKRVKQLRNGYPAMVESFESLQPEDIALREIIEKKLSYSFESGSERQEKAE